MQRTHMVTRFVRLDHSGRVPLILLSYKCLNKINTRALLQRHQNASLLISWIAHISLRFWRLDHSGRSPLIWLSNKCLQRNCEPSSEQETDQSHVNRLSSSLRRWEELTFRSGFPDCSTEGEFPGYCCCTCTFEAIDEPIISRWLFLSMESYAGNSQGRQVNQIGPFWEGSINRSFMQVPSGNWSETSDGLQSAY